MPYSDHIHAWDAAREAREPDPCPWDGRKPVMQVLTAPRWETRRLEARKAPRTSVLGWRAEPCPDFDADHAAEAELLRRWMP
jgi:hypothetical protein